CRIGGEDAEHLVVEEFAGGDVGEDDGVAIEVIFVGGDDAGSGAADNRVVVGEGAQGAEDAGFCAAVARVEKEREARALHGGKIGDGGGGFGDRQLLGAQPFEQG